MSIAAAPARQNRESEFLKRYHKLLRWAHWITNSDRALAEDIVQDAFIQFALSSTDSLAINNVDHYLREVVRNVHRTYARQTSPQRFEQLSTMPPDLLGEILSPAPDQHDLMDAKQTLLDVCQFVCKRKETSIAASVLTLRFFYGYSPEELARLSGRTRNAVDGLLLSARRELKEHLRRKQFFFEAQRLGDKNPVTFSVSPSDQSGLRRILSSARSGHCLNLDKIQMFYAGKTARVSREALSHLVSCAGCLDVVNKILGLPLLKERFSEDGLTKVAV